MAEKKAATKSKSSSARSSAAGKEFTEEERAAMRERVQELKTAARRNSHANRADAEAEVLAKLAAMPPSDRAIGERVHAILKANAPVLTPRLWYGMPAYANQDGNVVCFFQDAHKFKSRYATIGFSDKAHLDEGQMWPTGFAIKELGDAEEKKIAAVVKKALR